MSTIPAGQYVAKIISHGISETKNGAPQATIQFGFDVEGHQRRLTWYGSFKEGKAREITLKTLLECGLKGNNPAGDLEIGKEMYITVDDETGEDGKVRTKVKWVNSLGGVKNLLDTDLAKAKLGDLEGAIMKARQDLKIAEPDEIPF